MEIFLNVILPEKWRATARRIWEIRTIIACVAIAALVAITIVAVFDAYRYGIALVTP